MTPEQARKEAEMILRGSFKQDFSTPVGVLMERIVDRLTQSLINKELVKPLSKKTIEKIVWEIVCNECDCENSPECPEDYNGCVSMDIGERIYQEQFKEER